MFTLLPFRYLLGLLPLLLAGCAVYVPTTPSTPLVEEKQVEAWAGVRSFSTLEAGGAWSPRRHLLLTAETGWQQTSGSFTQNNQDTDYQDYSRQALVGIGYYRSSAPQQRRWYWAATAGAGFAATSLHAFDSNPFNIIYSNSYYGHFQARYWREYVQVYGVLAQGSRTIVGASLRTSFVNYQRLTLDNQPVSPAARAFAEPTIFWRLGQKAIQTQLSLGLSVPLGYQSDDDLVHFTAPRSSILSASLIVRPALLFHGRSRVGTRE